MNTRDGIHHQPIREAAAWTAASLGPDAKARVTRDLTTAELAAMDNFLARTRSRAAWDITAADAPALKPIADDIKAALSQGAGMIVVRGMDRGRLSKEDCERVFWALGTFMGDATMQNPKGDRITHVKHDKDVPQGRGYRSTAELSPHSDAYAILGLFCLERAEKGGVSRAASALAIHNEILQSRPELLEPMYRGTRYASSDARGTGIGPTAVNIPVFSLRDGKVSCFFSRQNMTEASRQTGEPLDPAFAEAADHFQALALDPRFMVEFMLDPGEMMFCNNYVLLHARTEFEDSERHTRDLLRLWVNWEAMRPVVPELHLFAKIYKDVFALRRAQATP
jgi:hypothetical protein